MVHVWRSENNLGCWSSPSTLLETKSLLPTAAYSRLAGLRVSRDLIGFTDGGLPYPTFM